MFWKTKYLWMSVASAIIIVSVTCDNGDAGEKVCSTSDKTCRRPDNTAPETSVMPPDDNSCVDDDLCRQKPTDIFGVDVLCDTDDWMLLHCPTLCQMCWEENGVMIRAHKAGLGSQVPPEISLQVLKHSRQSYNYWRTAIQENPLLSRTDKKRCRRSDHNNMCAFWSVRGRCTDPDYRTYMNHECPLSCRHVCEVQRGQAFWKYLWEGLAETYNDGTTEVIVGDKKRIVEKRHQTLSKLMTTLGMDPIVLLGKQEDGDSAFTSVVDNGNWLLELHTRIVALVPEALWKLYREDTQDNPAINSNLMSADDAAVLQELHNLDALELEPPKESSTDGTRVNNYFESMKQSGILMPYRNREASLVSMMRDVDHLVTRSIQLGVGFAVPNEEALTAIGQLTQPIDDEENAATIVHMGAGTGYWTSLLASRGIPVKAYDLHPPATTENAFFDVQYDATMKQGACIDIISGDSFDTSNAILLLIWPNDPDPIDNPHFLTENSDSGGKSQAVWDADCLLAFHQGGGQQVVYVGERLQDSLSGTRRFHGLLEAHFALQETISLPNWWLNEDDLTIWKRKDIPE